VRRVIDLLDYGLSREPDRVCLIDSASSFTHREVQRLSHRIAHALQSAGVGRGARVAFFTPNTTLAVIAMIGVFRAGAVWLPVHPRNVVEENSAFLAENECRFLFYHSRTSVEARTFLESIPTLSGAVCLDGGADHGPGLLEWSSGYPDRFDDSAASSLEDIAWVKGTGGTTGRSKSVLISNRSASVLFATFHWCLPLESGHVTLAAAPISHGAGTLALCSLCNGGTLVLIERAEPSAVLRALEQYAITTVFLPPTVIYGILALPEARSHKFPALRYLIYSAAPISPEKLREALEVFGPVLAQVYGQTEAPFMLTYLSPSEHLLEDSIKLEKRLLSCGRATPFVQVGIMDEDGHLLGPEEVGEIVVRSELVMRGYLGDQEATNAVSTHGWHHTGDVGKRDSEGFFYIVDRKKDMIISGGFNIFPSEIERVILQHASVLDCAVVGAPDEKWGEAVTAFVQLKAGSSVDGEVLRQFCRARLGGLKTPKAVRIVAELPKSSVGKVLKKEIRAQLWEGRARVI
jgi:acyl-CoA synthetase (AMP-forming)/AMP-acid ligase II